MRERNDLCKILSLKVRGIRDATTRRGIFSYLKDEKAAFYFYKKLTRKRRMKRFGKRNGEETLFFHMVVIGAEASVF